MAMPNGEMDPWADSIVARHFRYIQVSAFYDERADVPDSRLSELPLNAFGDWMRMKQPKILEIQVASDQVALLAASLPGFVVSVQKVSASLPSGIDPSGPIQLVDDTAGALAAARLWQLLLAPATFSK